MKNYHVPAEIRFPTAISSTAMLFFAFCATDFAESTEDSFGRKRLRTTPIWISETSQVQSAVSRKAHGVAGSFDVDLSPTGTTEVECRSGGATNDFTMVVTFDGNVMVTGTPQAEVTSGSGCVGSAGTCSANGTVTIAGNVVTIPLTNVTDQQTVNITLNGVNSASFEEPAVNVVIAMTRLLGDTNGNRAVNASDVSQTKARIGQPVDPGNFRSDVNANGAINAGDVALVKANSGHAVVLIDADGDGYYDVASGGNDCDDTNPNVHPGATEVCNGIDDDCNGAIDEDAGAIWYRDADQDTFGNPLVSVQACTQPSGYVSNNTDCDDSDARAHPGQTMFFTTPRSGGGFDYNCDLVETRQFPNLGNCSLMSGTCTLTPGWVSSIPACGQAANQVVACNPPAPCSQTNAFRIQPCR